MNSSVSKILYPIIAGICISLVGCSSPRYAPVTSRTPTKYNKSMENNIYHNPAPPTYNPNVNAIPNTNINSQPLSTEPAPRGYYRVMPGDTLYKIARENNIAPKDLIAWNAMENPNNIQPFQLIRISATTGVSIPMATTPTNNYSNTYNSTKPSINPSPLSSNYTTSNLNSSFSWPVKNPNIIKKFDGKGIDFSGKVGDSINATGDGIVIYANNMRGYGNLVIIGHSNDIVSAYAHLQQISVKEQQKVRKGQMIGTMGNSQSEQVKLHFEIRKKSEPVDPITYLK